MISLSAASLIGGGSTVSSSGTSPLGLAQAAQKVRYLDNLENALDRGDLAGAASALQQAANAFAVSLTSGASAPSSTDSTGSSSPSPDNIPADFQAISDAIGNQDLDSAKTAWTQLQSDLAAAGVTNLDANALEAQALSSVKTSTDSAILSSLGTSFSGSPSDNLESVVSQWLTYKQNGAAGVIGSLPGANLDTQS